MNRRALLVLLVLAGGGAWADEPPPGDELPPAAAAGPRLPGTKLLLLRLSLRMDRIDTEYMHMNWTQRSEQVQAAEQLLGQLRGRALSRQQQNDLFKIEMRLRTLRGELAR